MNVSDLSILVVGCGSAGSRLARLLHGLGVQDLRLFDSDSAVSGRLADELSAVVVSSVRQGIDAGVNGVVVASPPNAHFETAKIATESGASCFIEKPIADSMDSLEEWLDRLDDSEQFVMVGYNLRFFAPLVELRRIVSSGEIGRVLTVHAEFGQYLPTWRPGADYRRNYITEPAPVGGIILEESHEFDYVSWLAGAVDSVYCASGQLSDLEMESEDTALAILTHTNGALSHISVDCTQRGYARGAKVVGSEGTASWTFPSTISKVMNDGSSTTEVLDAEFADAYQLEMDEFVDCLLGNAEPTVTGREAMVSLRTTLAARESAATGSVVQL